MNQVGLLEVPIYISDLCIRIKIGIFLTRTYFILYEYKGNLQVNSPILFKYILHFKRGIGNLFLPCHGRKEYPPNDEWVKILGSLHEFLTLYTVV